jgi:hypothetical protein
MSRGWAAMFRPLGGADPRWHEYSDCPRAVVVDGPFGKEPWPFVDKLRIQDDGAIVSQYTGHWQGTMCPDCHARWTAEHFCPPLGAMNRYQSTVTKANNVGPFTQGRQR